MVISKEQAFLAVKIVEYLTKFPDDGPAIKAICVGASSLGATSAKEVAEMTAGRQLSIDEWIKFGPRWERVWSYIIES